MVLFPAAICTSDVMSRMHRYAEGDGATARIANVARVFVERHGDRTAGRCGEDQGVV